MIEPLQLDGNRHHSLHGADAGMVRHEMLQWLYDERDILRAALAGQTDYATLLRTQGAVQALEALIEPLARSPRMARQAAYGTQHPSDPVSP